MCVQSVISSSSASYTVRDQDSSMSMKLMGMAALMPTPMGGDGAEMKEVDVDVGGLKSALPFPSRSERAKEGAQPHFASFLSSASITTATAREAHCAD